MTTLEKRQVATLSSERVENGRNYGDTKETIGRLQCVAYDPEGMTYGDHFVTVVDARFYMGRSSQSSVIYCSVWVRARDGSRCWSGHGSAGGGGYHKQSAALQDALGSAGIGLALEIHGRGERAMEDALRAIAEACGYGCCPYTVLA